MRKIKFRAKTLANGHWVYGNLVIRDKECVSIRNCKSEPWVDPKTVGQFTGLTDCNGKEIYEGDILQIFEDADSCNEFVKFKEGCFMTDDGYAEYSFVIIDTSVRTVIGNIHDNPDLLKRGGR